VELKASLCAGHYVADVYNLDQQQWYHYDDEVVSQPTEDEVVGSARQRNGYVFCYMHRYHWVATFISVCFWSAYYVNAYWNLRQYHELRVFGNKVLKEVYTDDTVEVIA
jgi:hypothetical protein